MSEGMMAIDEPVIMVDDDDDDVIVVDDDVGHRDDDSNAVVIVDPSIQRVDSSQENDVLSAELVLLRRQISASQPVASSSAAISPVTVTMNALHSRRASSPEDDSDFMEPHAPPIINSIDLQETQCDSTSASNKRKRSLCEDSAAAKYIIECPICLEHCTNYGPHQIVAMRCGHLFGHSCITNWIKRKNTQKKNSAYCPSCKSSITAKSMIKLFSRHIVLLDTVERDAALLKVAQLRKNEAALLKRVDALETQLANTKLMRDIHKRDADNLKEELVKLKFTNAKLKYNLKAPMNDDSIVDLTGPSSNVLDLHSDNSKNQLTSVFKQRASVPLKPILGSSRCLEVSLDKQTLFVTLRQSENSGFGILKLCLRDIERSEFFAIHSEAIRDCQVHPTDPDIILTTSTDKTLKLTSSKSYNPIQSWPLPSCGWSCCFDAVNPHVLFVGLLNNTVLQFDWRNSLEAPSASFHIPFSRGKGVHSMRFIPSIPSSCHCTQTTTLTEGSIVTSSLDPTCHGFIIGATPSKVFLIPRNNNTDVQCGTTGFVVFDLSFGFAEALSCIAFSYDCVTGVWAAMYRLKSDETRYKMGYLLLNNADGPSLSFKFGCLNEISVSTYPRCMTRIALFHREDKSDTDVVDTNLRSRPTPYVATWHDGSAVIEAWDLKSITNGCNALHCCSDAVSTRLDCKNIPNEGQTGVEYCGQSNSVNHIRITSKVPLPCPEILSLHSVQQNQQGRIKFDKPSHQFANGVTVMDMKYIDNPYVPSKSFFVALSDTYLHIYESN